MKLVFYSGGQQRSNHRLHNAVVDLARQGRKRRGPLKLTYVPFCSDNSNVFYHRAKRRYKSHGIEEFFCLNVDTYPTPKEIREALQSDVIYLAGGNTFYFLKYLRESGFLSHLKAFAEKGGVIAGLSAGGLILTPTTALAADKGLGPDENEVGLTNFKSLGLVPFEFSPHFHPTPKQIKAHLAYSLKTNNPIYAIEDGGGIVVDGIKTSIYGKATVFFHGKELIVRE